MHELRVLTGLHRGAALPLIGERWTLGADESADLVLFDSAIKPQHCCLEWQEDGWAITGLQGQVTDIEGHRTDSMSALGLNIAFALNGVWLTIVAADTPWPSDDEDTTATPAADPTPAPVAKRRSSALPFFLGFLSAAAIVATSTWAALSPAPKPSPAPVTQAADDKHSLASADDVEQQLRQMLSDRELGHKVHVETRDQRVVLSGALTDKERARVDRMLGRFQRRFSTPLPIDNQVSSLSQSLPFEIAQITSGPMGSIVTQQGKRLFVGDQLDGLRLVSIDDHKVVFKGTQEVEVNW